MVETAVAPPRTAAVPRRAWWRTLWFIAPLLFIILLAVSRVVYWRTSIAYAPLRVAGAGAPAVGHPRHVTTGASGYSFPARARHEQMFEFPVQNDGIHPLDVLGVSVDDPSVVAVRWAADFVKNGKRVPSVSHLLPVHVPGHAIVNLQLIVRQPACSGSAPRYLSAVVVLHWHAMISPHHTRLNLSAGQPHRFTLCRGT